MEIGKENQWEQLMLQWQSNIGDGDLLKQLVEYSTIHSNWEWIKGCYIDLAIQSLIQNVPQQALTWLDCAKNATIDCDKNKLPIENHPDINYWCGIVYERLRMADKAHEAFTLTTEGVWEPTLFMSGNELASEYSFYQALAMQKLGLDDKAKYKFVSMLSFAEKHIADKWAFDEKGNAKLVLLNWNEDLTQKSKLYCNFLTGLGNLGVGRVPTAIRYFNAVIGKNSILTPAYRYVNMASNFGF